MFTGRVSWAFPNFDPSMDVGTSTIECLNWCSLYARAVTMVVKESDLLQMVSPTISIVNHSCSEHISLCSNRSLILAIGLQIIGGVVPKES